MKGRLVCFTTLAFLVLGIVNGFSQVTPGTLVYFPQVAAGSAAGSKYFSIYSFINPGATTLQVRIEFFDSNGNPLNLQLQFTDGISETSLGTTAAADITIGPNATVLVFAQLDGTLRTGWARVSSSGPVWALCAFEFANASNGNTISTVGVPPTTTLQDATIFSVRDIRDQLDVGVAMANPSAAPITITATLFDSRGVQVSQVLVNLAARGHRALFTGELFPTIGSNFLGKVTFASTTPFAIMGLVLDGPLMTSIPVFRR